MKGIVEIMKNVAQIEFQGILTTELGIVTAVFPHKDENDKENYQCSVKLKNKKKADGSDFELRKIPVSTPYIGMVCIPNVGDLVLIQFIGGDINAPVITGRVYNDEDIPPVNNENEFLIQHKNISGGNIKLDPDGKIIVTSKSQKNIFTVEDEKVSIETEKLKLIIDTAGELITVESSKDIEVKAGGNVKVDGAQAVEIIAAAGLTLNSGDCSAWAPNTLPVCSFTGAPHGGSGAGVVNLKGK